MIKPLLPFGAFRLTVILAGADEVAPLLVAIPANDPNIRYVGRFDTRDAAGPHCSWPGSTVELKFQGTDLNATLHDQKTLEQALQADLGW